MTAPQKKIVLDDDWPLIALSMTLDCSIWTEDQDFFGTGVATWRTRYVEIYLSD